jgi:protein gp37
MGVKTGIEWTDHTFNAWIGCTKVSEGCRNCYAARDNEHWKWNGGAWGPGALRKVTGRANWREPLKWAKAARAAGVREKVFCNSLSDTFDIEAPRLARKDLWLLVGDTFDALDWQFVTKRSERISEVMDEDGLNSGFFELCKCWLLTTTEDQAAANLRIPYLLDIPAAVHGVSAEPLLGPLDLSCIPWLADFPHATDGPGSDGFDALRFDDRNSLAGLDRLDWVICGGESGPHARPMHPDWARSLRDQCAAAGVAFFFKQWGDWAEVGGGKPNTEHVNEEPPIDSSNAVISPAGHRPGSFDEMRDGVSYRWMSRIGKEAAGTMLDSCEWKQFPVARP